MADDLFFQRFTKLIIVTHLLHISPLLSLRIQWNFLPRPFGGQISYGQSYKNHMKSLRINQFTNQSVTSNSCSWEKKKIYFKMKIVLLVSFSVQGWAAVFVQLQFVTIKSYYKLQALLVCLVAVAYVHAAPYEESVIGDSVDAFHPSDDSEFSKKALIKGLIIIKVKKVKKLLG